MTSPCFSLDMTFFDEVVYSDISSSLKKCDYKATSRISQRVPVVIRFM